MQIYEKRNDTSYRTTPRCGYCRQEGHNKYKCPLVAKDWESWKDFKVPERKQGWYMSRSNPKHWGEWYDQCLTVYTEQERRKNKPKTTRTRALPSCGYCRSGMHTRRNCPDMKEFLQKCYKANENWRRAAYKEVVEKHGICVGAAIMVKKSEGWGSNAKILSEVGLITKVNFESLNVMAAKNCYYSGNVDPYACGLEVYALVDGQEKPIKAQTTKSGGYSDTWLKDSIRIDGDIVVRSNAGYYQTWNLDKVLSRSEHPLDENWVTDYKGAFELLLKKRSKEQLDNDGITSLINEWAKKD